MTIRFWNVISMFFIALTVFAMIGFVFFGDGQEGLTEMAVFGVIAVIFWYPRAFLVFVFYFVLVSLVMIVGAVGIAYTLHFTIYDITAENLTEIMFFFFGGLTLDFGITAYLTKRELRREKMEMQGLDEEEYYEKPPNPNDFNEDNEEEQRRREEEAYEKGRQEAERTEKKMSVEESYKILGVKPDASKDEIKKAYRKLGKLIHPDATQMDTNELMKEINEAYSRLQEEGKV